MSWYERKGEKMTRVYSTTREELIAERDEILGRHRLTLEEFSARAADFSLIGDQWAAWSDLQDIAYLLGDDAC